MGLEGCLWLETRPAGHQGFLGHERFTELGKLEDDQNPFFIERVVNVFLKDQTPNDITRIGQVFIGAKRVHTEMVNMMACFREDYIHIGGVRAAFSRLKEEFAMLKDKLEAYLGLFRPTDQHSESADSNSPIN
ncbi:histidine-containing phosphotransfer protein 4-like [Carya illinoinensis]|uniref:histidine-containing phosphotransfer protein 4-like n=1 Tax=Carya illinoinensis TaxID=32201 RepID=UPI001C717EB4|nr:histidine-containing phosphotransfer protein 4-like [Carya illinoinensis]